MMFSLTTALRYALTTEVKAVTTILRNHVLHANIRTLTIGVEYQLAPYLTIK